MSELLIPMGKGPQFGPGDLAEIGVHLDQQDLKWQWTGNVMADL